MTSTHHRRLALAAAALAATFLTTAAGAYVGPKPQSFDVELAPVGDSGVTGIAHLVLRGDHLSIQIRAFGLDPLEVHPAALDGAQGGRSSLCPTSDTADEVKLQVVSPAAGGPVTGRDRVALVPPPTSDGRGAVVFEHEYTIDASRLTPLGSRTLVLYDLDSGGRPVACGRIAPYE